MSAPLLQTGGGSGGSGNVTGTGLTSGNFITGAGSSAIQDSGFPFFFDPTQYVFLWTDFTGSLAAGVFPGMFPFTASVVGSATISSLASEPGTCGLAQISTGATISSIGILTSVLQILQRLDNAAFDSKFRVKVNSTTSAQYFFGFNKAEAAGEASTDFIGIAYDSTQDGTTWHLVQRSASGTIVRTNIPSNGTVSTSNYQTLRIRSTAAGTILASVDGGTEVSINSGLPSVVLAPQFSCKTIASANSLVVKCDYFWGWFAISR